mgnify:FL=1
MTISFIYPWFLLLLLLIPLTVGLALAGRRGLNPLRFWGGLGLRSLLLLLIVLALAGIQVHLPSNLLTAVFVLDVSDSVSPEEQARAEDWVRAAVEEMPVGDRAAIVLFGEDALVERLASEDRILPDLASVPVTTRTDIASALQLALALFPDEGAGRIVLLSDGRENLDNALRQADLAAMQGIQLQFVPLGQAAEGQEVLLDSLEAPPEMREGQQFDLDISVESSERTGATLRVFADGALIQTQEVQLQPGINRYSIPVRNVEAGFHRYRVQVVPDGDTYLQNNEASAFTVVYGAPGVLVVEGQDGEAANLVDALEAAEMRVTRIAPAQMPVTLPELARYEAVVLVNVPAPALPGGAMESLPVYVRDLGKGLLMIGGQNTFGAGGYLRSELEKALPVDMDVKSRERSANLALVLTVDKSGSMGRCHCDDPDLFQTYTRQEVGQPKVDIAKEAIMRSASALSVQDYLGVVAFDTASHWALQMGPLVDELTLEGSIGAIVADGSTNMESGVLAAYDALKDIPATRKHIILMTDGWVRTGDLTPLVEQMRDQGITLSVIAAGEGSAEYLEALAEAGGGRFYPATDILHVPDIFLKETVQSVGQYVIEEPLYPLPGMSSPILKGVDEASLPALLGYNGTSAKNTARIDLLTPRGDPLLASWQYGLGRAAVWTSDLKGQWAREWVGWDSFPRFASQLVGWVLPMPQVEGLSAGVALEDDGAVIRLDAEDPAGRPLDRLNVTARLVDPDLQVREIELRQVGAGQYQSLERLPEPGAYLVQINAAEGGDGAPLGQVTAGLVVPYSPEYRAQGTNRGLLDALARTAGGGEIADPLRAFVHDLQTVAGAREIWWPLLLAAALLFPLDVAVRRLVITRHDVRRARAWIAERLPGRKGAEGPSGPVVLGDLFRARDRARRRSDSRAGRAPEKPREPEQRETPPAPTPPPEEPVDTLARLRESKKKRKS